MKIEILITQLHDNTFCNDKKSLIHLIQADCSLSYSNSKIKIDDCEFPITINVLDPKLNKHKCFHITITGSESNIEQLTKLKRTLRIIMKKAFETEPQIIWDDTDAYYATKAYPLLNEIENLMRKFLTQFLLINIGIEWTKETTPQDIKNKVENRKRDINSNYLSGTDFIDLKSFLFNKYTKYTTESIFKKISEMNDTSNGNEIKNMLPRSNWERYFKEHIDCQESTLNEKWQQLYELRCQVAHNAPFKKSDYENVTKLIEFIKPIIETSINKLSLIIVSDSDREELKQSNVFDVSDYSYLWEEQLANTKNYAHILMRKENNSYIWNKVLKNRVKNGSLNNAIIELAKKTGVSVEQLYEIIREFDMAIFPKDSNNTPDTDDEK
ncbi:hypothetical protein [Serratia fonticola]